MKLFQGRSLLKKWKPNYIALSFFIPFFLLVLMMILIGAMPFGSSKSMLYSDMWHQYFPFFKEYREALRSGESLLHSWNVGMGMDYLGLISYYLCSPLYLVSVILPDSWVLPYFCMLVPVKLGLASMFFAIFLKKLFKKNDVSIAVFGAFYGLCAWALGYQWNIMWLDTFALLPLVALGTIYLLRDRKFILYTITLTLSILINYYIGFFTCIFVLILFICYQICNCKSVKRFFQDLARIAVFSVLAIGMTAVISLPALAALGDTYSSVNSFPDSFYLNILEYEKYETAREAWEAYEIAKAAGNSAIGLWFTAIWKSIGPVLYGMGCVAGNMSGGMTPSFMEGLPNVYSGVSTLILSFLFLTVRKIKLREKLCCVFVLLFLAASCVIRELDYIWHGFHFPNMIPHRFSFIFTFVMLYMAYRAYTVRHRFRPIHLVFAGLLTLEIFFLSTHISKVPEAIRSLGQVLGLIWDALSNGSAVEVAISGFKWLHRNYGDVYVFLLFNIVFFIIYFVVMLYPALRKSVAKLPTWRERKDMAMRIRSRRRLSSKLLTFVMVMELCLTVFNFGRTFHLSSVKDYPKGTEDTASMIRYIQEREEARGGPLFYRVETTHSQTLNDGALNGYYGISTFSSSANANVTRFMTALGFASQDNWNRYCFEESSPVANLFLNLKYMLERDGAVEENPYFNDVIHFDKVHLLENNAYLPLGFLAESSLADLEMNMDNSNGFSNQNAMFTAATGIQEDVWEYTPGSWLSYESDGVDMTGQSDNGYCSYMVHGSQGTLTYRYAIEETGFLCLDMNLRARNDFHVYLNNELLYSEDITLPQMFAVSQVKPGDVVEIRIVCTEGEESSMRIQSALLNDEVFRKGYEILNASTLELTEFSTTEAEGTISCNRDGLLYTSIPDNGNWTAYVDGKEAEVTLVGGAMIGVHLTEGEHTVRFVYRNSAYTYGMIISVTCLLIFLALIYLSDRKRWNERVLKICNKFKKK